MTQIISVITREYVLLVSDRLLTYGPGPRAGEVFKDEECKLVSLCHTCGIGYTGLARLGGRPTHEWIAITLARANCHTAGEASELLITSAPAALPNVDVKLRRQTFVIAGWAHFGDVPTLRSHICVVSNCLGENREQLTHPQPAFRRRIRTLQDHEDVYHFVVGQPVAADRTVQLERNLRRLAARDIGQREALRLLVAEIFATHSTESSVGDKVLAFCIPRTSIESQIKSGHTRLSGVPPHSRASTFSYFDRDYNEHLQHGPTVVCGQFAATDLKYENDPTKPLQSVQLRMLHAPQLET